MRRMNSKSNTMRGEMNGGESTGKDFANVLNLDRMGLETEGQVEKGLRGGRISRGKQEATTVLYDYGMETHPNTPPFEGDISHIQGQNSMMPASVTKEMLTQ